ncbi:Cell wall synthesis protein kre9 precursor [Ophidiomyces ophidiicola]|uniref:Cell wall synthesis protein kre9 n=1 Tax=Ophidiomyces ophidiicola TaxID=1387563 RepID=A0ACB8V2F8_9EURO|nr:Cell wall synthesis protein kre9 precursor [Ophidiomyces ophidiicola]KAI1921078.1 Cell wall synthesis protein kre9 precursor [Ophidiomyces ophidiicola]KAI1938308.1 Cell wall synthesis protein kre9 precursor [Ophidiomyces ophidiicola]KAI1961842.1 Cell wall synthesis protein kre9 precursor [Ophidiomyces ophidiicola]KAI1976059.1 Cell wall synthesis protein kre9 precursor [Ophidiomyces ophidiicola]KAI1997861.1 Cell wall synthesis protein kre9 precursor [Ophidiomyces ophidiicola]
MKLRLPQQLALLLLTLPLPAVSSLVEFVEPAAGAVLEGGKPIRVQWKLLESAKTQLDSNEFNLDLCAGGNDADTYVTLASLVEKGVLGETDSVSTTVDPKLGGEHPNAYFFQLSVGVTNGTTSFFSDRFSLNAMTGTFSQRVASAIEALGGSTTGPRSLNNLSKRQVVVIPPGADPDLPYSAQTGPTRYAPIPKPPPFKMSLKNAPPLYPTSDYEIARTKLPTPTIMTTVSRTVAASVQEIENTAAPAERDMQRFLKRWED